MFTTADLPQSMQAREGDEHVCGTPGCGVTAPVPTVRESVLSEG